MTADRQIDTAALAAPAAAQACSIRVGMDSAVQKRPGDL